MSFKFREGQLVAFFVQVDSENAFSGEGIIIGCASTPVAVVGASYIIKPTKFYDDVVIPSETYPFSTVSIHECFINDVFCLGCDEYSPNIINGGVNPNNCTKWLCNCGDCPHDADIVEIQYGGRPMKKKESCNAI